MKKILKKISWSAPEFIYYHKSAAWYWMSIIIAATLFLVSIWQNNLLLAIFVVIAEITVVSWAKQRPRNLDFEITEKGVSLDKLKFYAFEDLNGFHIIDGPEKYGELILREKKKLNPYVKVNVLNKDIEEIKGFLKEHIGEMEYTEPLSDAISKMIGF